MERELAYLRATTSQAEVTKTQIRLDFVCVSRTQNGFSILCSTADSADYSIENCHFQSSSWHSTVNHQANDQSFGKPFCVLEAPTGTARRVSLQVIQLVVVTANLNIWFVKIFCACNHSGLETTLVDCPSDASQLTPSSRRCESEPSQSQ